MKIAERHENLLKAIHACKDLPEEFSARHLNSRIIGLALKDAKNFDLKIALVNCLGPNPNIKSIGILLQDKLSGVRIGDYRLDGRRSRAGDGRVSWKYFLQYFGAPIVEPVKPEPKPMTLDSLVADQEAAEKLARDQQSRLEKAENREVLDELARKNKEQRRAMKLHEPYPGFIEENERAYHQMEASKPFPKFRDGLVIDRPGHECHGGVFHLDPQTGGKTIRMPNGKSWGVQESPEPDTRPGGDMLKWYEQQTFLAMKRGDTRSIEEIAASARVWSPRGVGNFIGSAMPINRGTNFYADNVSESDALDRKFRGY